MGKTTKNDGFSLVELIIVIAIMAVLAGAMAPALIRYIDKSRKADDLTSAKAIKTAIEVAMADETVFETLTVGCSGNPSCTDMDGRTFTVASAMAIAENHQIVNGNLGIAVNSDASSADQAYAEERIANNIGEVIPRVRYRKPADATKTGTIIGWRAFCTNSGTVVVGINSTDGFYQLVPELSKFY